MLSQLSGKGNQAHARSILYKVVIIDLCLERFSFSSTSDISFHSSSVPGHSLTQLLLQKIYNPNSPG